METEPKMILVMSTMSTLIKL